MVIMSSDDFPISKKTFNLAAAFHASADRLVKWLNNEVEWQQTPAEACCVVVNYSFAAELYLKSILYKEIQDESLLVTGHKLSELFDRLSAIVKDALCRHQVLIRPDCEGIEIGEFDIKATLARYDTAFIEYRYLYEEKNKHVTGSIAGLLKACHILKSVSKSIVFG
jgi:hypothetical protein